MRITKRVLFFSILALVFSVAVSGGCGGSSSGHYYGNFGNSSQDVTPPVTPESQDVIPEPLPENPTSEDQNGDDYGVNEDELTGFSKLHNTTWKITEVSVSAEGRTCNVSHDSYSHKNISLLKLQISNSWLAWYDEADELQLDDLTVEFTDTTDNSTHTAPLLITIGGFEISTDAYFIAKIKNDYGSIDQERVTLLGSPSAKNFPDELLITNIFTDSNNVQYTADIRLKRVYISNISLYRFGNLNNTKWEATNFGMFYVSSGNKYICTFKYPNITEINLATSGDKLVWYDDKDPTQPHDSDDLTMPFYKFGVNQGTDSLRAAPILRPTSGFKLSDNDDDFTYVAQIKNEDGITETEEIEFREMSGDVAIRIRIFNTFKADDNHWYQARMDLTTRVNK